MTILTVETKVTRSYLMNKSKSDLAQWILELLDEVERLREDASREDTHE